MRNRPRLSLAVLDAAAAAYRATLDQTAFWVFSNGVVFALFTGFLLPILSLSFATEALGGEREDNSLVWLLTRPLPRPAVYLAKFTALLPWSIGLNVGGENDRAQVPAFAKEFGIEYPLGFPDDALVNQYLTDNQNIPQAFVFDRNGELVKRFVGYNSTSGGELERIIKGALAAGPVAQQTR